MRGVHLSQLSIILSKKGRLPSRLLAFSLLGLVDLNVGRFDFCFRVDLLHGYGE
jgi:hypothetical protein